MSISGFLLLLLTIIANCLDYLSFFRVFFIFKRCGLYRMKKKRPCGLGFFFSIKKRMRMNKAREKKTPQKGRY